MVLLPICLLMDHMEVLLKLPPLYHWSLNKPTQLRHCGKARFKTWYLTWHLIGSPTLVECLPAGSIPHGTLFCLFKPTSPGYIQMYFLYSDISFLRFTRTQRLTSQ